MIVERIKAMLEACEAGTAAFPPSVLYNEDWLLRIVLDWFARHGGDRYPLSPRAGARWFSQAWLPSAFLPRYRGDRLAEARTHADGVLGHFAIGDPGTAALTLTPDAPAARRHRGQAVRPALGRRPERPLLRPGGAERRLHRRDPPPRRARPEEMDDLAFLFLAPQARIDDGIFDWDPALEAIRRKVRRRVEDYAGERDAWFRDWFEPTWRRVEVRCLSWEEIVEVDRVPQPGGGPGHRQLLRPVPALQPAPGAGGLPGRRSPSGQGLRAAPGSAGLGGGLVDAMRCSSGLNRECARDDSSGCEPLDEPAAVARRVDAAGRAGGSVVPARIRSNRVSIDSRPSSAGEGSSPSA